MSDGSKIKYSFVGTDFFFCHIAFETAEAYIMMKLQDLYLYFR